ncbi:DNA-binding protein [Apiospora phragmitis]|uniref:DNA-binding protein n=1 Tax=Apiospora phragmitis TaxID=2905665 RepID=A0ABR1TTX9_9PEZI
MRLRLGSWWSTSLRRQKQNSSPNSGPASGEEEQYGAEDMIILEDPAQYLSVISSRKSAAPQGILKDSPLFALYRLYEFIVLDRVLDYRNCLEAFWRRRDWPVSGIADPADDDPERYAFLAGCTYLMARSFNQRVKLGLNRNMPTLMIPEEAEAARNVPEHLRQWEEVPQWAKSVPPLSQPYALPTDDGEVLETRQDPRADPDFLAKNTVLWTPHIFFT